jgi:hypothetical protein
MDDPNDATLALRLALARIKELTADEQLLVRVRAETVRMVAKESQYGLLAVVLVGSEIIALTQTPR